MKSGGALWRHQDFLKLWTAQAISAFGSRISRTALPIVALLTIQASPAEIGILSALSFAPGVVVGLLGGGYVDRSAKRPLLIGADLARAALLLTVPAAAWLDVLAMWQLYLVAAGVGAASVLFQIADNTYLPALIGKALLVEGNSKLESTDAVAEIGGPSVAGILIDILSGPMVVLFDAFSYLVSAAFLARIRKPEPPAEAEAVPASLASDLRAGLRAGFGEPLVRALFLAEGSAALFNGFFVALYVVFTIETLGLSPGVVGVLIGAGGAGALMGAVLSRLGPRFFGLGPAMIVMAALGQSAALLIPLASGPEWRVLTFLGAHQVFGDAFLVAYLIHAVSLRQTVLPASVLGRANATLQVVTGLLLPLGAVASGWLATALGVRTAVWIGVLGGFSAPMILAASPIRRLQSMPAAE